MSQASPCSETTFVLLGKVVKAHGIRGGLKVHSYTEAPERFSQYQRLYLTMDGQPPNMPAPFWTNRHSQGAGQRLILQLAECSSREQAEALCGATIWLPAAELPPLPEGEFYLHSLQGKEVRLLGAEATLGHVTGLLSTLEQDILVIRQDEDEFLVPAVRDFFVSVDETSLVLRLPPGLLEINRQESKQEAQPVALARKKSQKED